MRSFMQACIDRDMISDWIFADHELELDFGTIGFLRSDDRDVRVYRPGKPGRPEALNALIGLTETDWLLLTEDDWLFIRSENLISRVQAVMMADSRVKSVLFRATDWPWLKRGTAEYRLGDGLLIEPGLYQTQALRMLGKFDERISPIRPFGWPQADRFLELGFRQASLTENHVIRIADGMNDFSQIGHIDIIIPSLRTHDELRPMMAEIDRTASLPHRVIATGIKASASVNRNFGLKCASSKILIMLDDDVSGFYPGWDRDLVRPMLHDPSLAISSARLMTLDGKAGANCAENFDLETEYIYVEPTDWAVIPSAAIAFRNQGIHFDDGMRGSGWEDTRFCWEYIFMNFQSRFIINNRCKLIHANEAKNQGGDNWEFNRRRYQKWKGSRQK